MAADRAAGVLSAPLTHGVAHVRLDDGRTIVCTVAAPLRRRHVRLDKGARVQVEVFGERGRVVDVETVEIHRMTAAHRAQRRASERNSE